jgi:hypothetical protein
VVLENDDKGEVLATLVIVWEGRGRVDCVCVCGKGDRGAECLVHGCLSATLMCGLRGEDRGKYYVWSWEVGRGAEMSSERGKWTVGPVRFVRACRMVPDSVEKSGGVWKGMGSESCHKSKSVRSERDFVVIAACFRRERSFNFR